jgi:Putative lumazine-binding
MGQPAVGRYSMGDLQIETAIAPPSADDVEAITAVARDYVEGYFDGDEARMRRCLHPELVKRTIWHHPETGDWELGRPSSAEAMIGWARDGVGRAAVDGGRPIAITIEDVFRHIASVKVLSLPFMDYLHIAKIGDRWLIVNVLWELREGERQPPSPQ